MPTIQFKATPYTIGDTTLVSLPTAASAQLPSRGMVLVEGTVNGSPFKIPLEPDGRGGHWLQLEGMLESGKPVEIAMEPSKEWPEPTIPADIQAALKADDTARATWSATTPMARWDWLRWINATNNQETRQRRVSVAVSKLRNGSRRPCCFNRNMCCDPAVSKNGVLLVAATATATDLL